MGWLRPGELRGGGDFITKEISNRTGPGPHVRHVTSGNQSKEEGALSFQKSSQEPPSPGPQYVGLGTVRGNSQGRGSQAPGEAVPVSPRGRRSDGASPGPEAPVTGVSLGRVAGSPGDR